MSGDYCEIVSIPVQVQKNGIIRLENGTFIGRITESETVNFESLKTYNLWKSDVASELTKLQTKLLGNTAEEWMGMYHVAADRADKAEAELNQTYIDKNGATWGRPTADAYYAVCTAVHKYQSENAKLRRALQTIIDSKGIAVCENSMELLEWEPESDLPCPSAIYSHVPCISNCKDIAKQALAELSGNSEELEGE